MTGAPSAGWSTSAAASSSPPSCRAIRTCAVSCSTSLAGAKEVLASAGVLDRCELVSGDFFDTLPEGADAYVLINILHDWDDDTATNILRNCRQAMSDQARLLVIDYLVPVDSEPHPAKGMDMAMLVLTGGRERTQAELEELLRRAKLILTEAHSVPRSLSIVEARPAPPA
jgi:hypothetical protein